MTQDFSIRAVTEAEELIAAAELPQALDKLQTAAAYVPWSLEQGEVAALVERIRQAADAIATAAPDYAPEVQAIKELLASREVGGEVAEAEEREPWFYGIAGAVAVLAVVASVLSLILGTVASVEVSQYRLYYAGPTRHHPGVLALGIVSSLFTALVWLGLAAAFRLVVDNGRMLRELRGQAQG